jgi:hypothetical protein
MERDASRAEQYITSTIVFAKLYRKTKEREWLNEIMYTSTLAVNSADKLHDGTYKDVILKAENNKAFSILINSQVRNITPPDSDIDYLVKAANDLSAFLTTKPSYDGLYDRHLQEFEDTSAQIKEFLASPELAGYRKRKQALGHCTQPKQ